MNNTALRAGLLSASGACLATTEAERRPQSANNTHMVFANEEHEKFYFEKLEQARYQDCYHKALIYILGISEDTRNHFSQIYDIKSGYIKTECLHQDWRADRAVSGCGMSLHLLLFDVILTPVYAVFRKEAIQMEKKEVKKWQDEEALRRYRMIAPLLDPDMDEGKRQQMRDEAAEKNGVSKRTLYWYEKGYREEGFGGLRPAGRTKKRQQRLPENFEEIMGEAVQLKREVPKRSVRQFIKILELEGWAAPGVMKQSTMQRHLYEAGLGRKQMKRYAEKRASSDNGCKVLTWIISDFFQGTH